MELELCYVPGYRKPLKEQLEGFFEYLLNRVDYEDKKAVELLYDCYLLCVREQSGICEIRERIERKREEKEEEESKREEKMPWKPEKKEEVIGEQTEKETASSYVTWLTDRFFHRKKKEALLVAEERSVYRARGDFESETRQEECLSEKTALLSVSEEKTEPQLIDERTGEVIYIKKFPFYIGSVEKYADYVLKQSGVSRIHCCINKKEEEYYLSDLNSTNGTYLDGEEVLPGKEERLCEGMMLKIAKAEFYVKVPCH